MQVIECHGTPYEVGFQHGRRLADRVHACHAVYCRFPGLSGEQVQHAAQAIEAAHQARLPESLVELQGIADGSGLPVQDVLQLNFCMDIVADAPLRCSIMGLPTRRMGADRQDH